MKKVQVITITFNNYEELISTVESLKPAFGDIELLVINGGSCLQTLQYLERENIKHITEKDSGISDAFNKGLANSTCEYIHILNSGDFLNDPSFYIKCIEMFEKDKEISFIYSNIYYDHKDLGRMLIKPNLKAFKNIAYGMPFPHPGLVIRKNVLDTVIGFDTNLRIAMDYDFVMRMLDNYQHGVYSDTESVLMDGKGISSSNTVNSVKECFSVLQKNQKMDLKNFSIIALRYVRTVMGSKASSIFLKKIIHKNKVLK